MSSILSGSFEKDVTTDWLREFGFGKAHWGSPFNVTYKNGRRTCEWHPHQRCWEFYETTEHYYVGHLIYFPEKFKGFINVKNDNAGVHSENPAGYVYILVDNDDLDWHEKIYVKSQADIEAAYNIMKKKSEELNKDTWYYSIK